MHHYQRVNHNMEMHIAVVVEDRKFISVFVTTVVGLHDIYFNKSIYSHMKRYCDPQNLYILPGNIMACHHVVTIAFY